MQHESAIVWTGPAEIDRLVDQNLRFETQAQALEQAPSVISIGRFTTTPTAPFRCARR